MQVDHRRIAMFHIGRSGSSVLADMLSQHENLVWEGEIYMPLLKKLGQSDSKVMRLPNPLTFAAERFDANAATHYGFEIKFFHLDILGTPLKDYVEGLKQNGVDRIIVLRRKNHLRKVVSSLIAKETGIWHVRDDRQPKSTAVRIDVDKLRLDRQTRSLMAFLNQFEKDFNQLDALLSGLPTLRISYEEDVESDPLVGYHKIINFCGLDPIDPVVRLKRTNPYILRDLIVNYEEVSEYLSDSDYAWMAE